MSCILSLMHFAMNKDYDDDCDYDYDCDFNFEFDLNIVQSQDLPDR